jgi:hypothetical protein
VHVGHLALATVVGLCVVGWPAQPSAAAAPPTTVWSAHASGPAVMVVGSNPFDLNSTQPTTGTIAVALTLAPIRGQGTADGTDFRVTASVIARRTRYDVRLTGVMSRHPSGRPAVVLTDRCGKLAARSDDAEPVPSVGPTLSLWGWVDVARAGVLLARRMPAHLLVMTHPPILGVALEVATGGRHLRGVPGGYLHVVWPDVTARCTSQV